MSNFAIIKAELDGNAGLYGAMTDQQVADELNAVDKTDIRATVSGAEIFNATDDAEYAAKTDAQKSAWDSLCAITEIDTTSGIAKAREAEIFGVGTTTRANLQALRNVTVSRASQIGAGVVRTSNVTSARAL